jgi:hypothetical protein
LGDEMASGGASCTVRDGSCGANGYTYFTKANVFTAGTISSFCFYLTAGTLPTSVKLKVFRQNGTNIDYVAESASQTPYQNGLNSFNISPITVQAGDYIGFYIIETGAKVESYNIGSPNGTGYYLLGDITSNHAESDYTQDLEMTDVSLRASSDLVDVYVNSSTGNNTYAGDSCVAGHPVLTFAKAYELLTSGGMIHVCNNLADFSAETITLNKSFSIDLNGSDGYFYMPQAS